MEAVDALRKVREDHHRNYSSTQQQETTSTSSQQPDPNANFPNQEQVPRVVSTSEAPNVETD